MKLILPRFIRITLVLGALIVAFNVWKYYDRVNGSVIAESENPISLSFQRVCIREFKSRGLLGNDFIDSTFRFEEWDRYRLVSCVSKFIGSYPVKSCEVRWSQGGTCICIINGKSWATFTSNKWELSPPSDLNTAQRAGDH